jgi:hypothetical protein
MIDNQVLELRLAAALGAPMSAQQRAELDARVFDLIARTRPARRSFGFRLTRGTALAVGLTVLLASVFGAWGAMKLTEAPYGMQDAAAYSAEIDAAKAVTPLPPGATWPARLDSSPDPNAIYAVRSGQSLVEFNAACIWFGYWLDESRHGTPTQRADALAGVLAMGSWTTFSDRSINQSIDYFASLLDAARRGDAAPIRQFVAVNCAE